MLTLFAAIFAMTIFAIPAGIAQAEGDGLITKRSDFGVTKTLDRLGIALERAGIKVFARIDHAKGAKSVGMDLPPTAVIIFGPQRLARRS